MACTGCLLYREILSHNHPLAQHFERIDAINRGNLVYVLVAFAYIFDTNTSKAMNSGASMCMCSVSIRN